MSGQKLSKLPLDLETVNNLRSIFFGSSQGSRFIDEIADLVLKYCVALQLRDFESLDTLLEQKNILLRGFIVLLKIKIKHLYLITCKINLTDAQVEHISQGFVVQIKMIEESEIQDFFRSMFMMLINFIRYDLSWNWMTYRHHTSASVQAFREMIFAAPGNNFRLQQGLLRHLDKRTKKLFKELEYKNPMFQFFSPNRSLAENIRFLMPVLVFMLIVSQVVLSLVMAGVDSESVFWVGEQLIPIACFLAASLPLLFNKLFSLLSIMSQEDLSIAEKCQQIVMLRPIDIAVILAGLQLYDIITRRIAIGITILLFLPWNYVFDRWLKEILTIENFATKHQEYLRNIVTHSLTSLEMPALPPVSSSMRSARSMQVLPREPELGQSAVPRRGKRGKGEAAKDLESAQEDMLVLPEPKRVLWVFTEDKMVWQLQVHQLSPRIEMILGIWHRYVVPLYSPNNHPLPKDTFFLYWSKAMVCDILHTVLNKEGDIEALFKVFERSVLLGKVVSSQGKIVMGRNDNGQTFFKIRQHDNSHQRLLCEAAIHTGEGDDKRYLYYPTRMTND